MQLHQKGVCCIQQRDRSRGFRGESSVDGASLTQSWRLSSKGTAHLLREILVQKCLESPAIYLYDCKKGVGRLLKEGIGSGTCQHCHIYLLLQPPPTPFLLLPPPQFCPSPPFPLCITFYSGCALILQWIWSAAASCGSACKMATNGALSAPSAAEEFSIVI